MSCVMTATYGCIHNAVNVDSSINMTRHSQGPPAWVSAAEASRTLGITRQTLYAYVSRGLIRSEPGASTTRERRYAREDIERLKRRAEERRDPDKVASHALQWGMPVLESAITLI